MIENPKESAKNKGNTINLIYILVIYINYNI